MGDSKPSIDELLEDIGAYIRKRMIMDQKELPRHNWRTIHQTKAHEIKKAIIDLKPIIEEAAMSVSTQKGRLGRRGYLSLSQKVTILLVLRVLGSSTRNMAYMLMLFSSLSGIYLSYKTIQRLYSDNETYTALFTLREMLYSGYIKGRSAAL